VLGVNVIRASLKEELYMASVRATEYEEEMEDDAGGCVMVMDGQGG
jgi:hypothetical protein